MANSSFPAPSSAQPVVPSNGTSQQPVVIVNTSQPVRSARRHVASHQNQMVSIGGGALFPHIKCSRNNLLPGVLAMGGAAILVYSAKLGYDWCKEHFITKNKDEDKVQIPDPPKVEAVVACVNSAGKPKAPLIPDMVYERTISIVAGRPNGGKTLLSQQMAIEIARGYGDLVSENAIPQNVIIIDGEMDDDDYKRRFGGEDMEIPANITRVSESDFSTLKQLTEYIKKMVEGLTGPVVIVIDNIAALTLETLSGKIVNEFFRDLKKIQRSSEHSVSFIVADHIGKTPVGQSLDDSSIAGSANVARFAQTIVFVDFSARGSDYRYIKFSKLRKGALPDEVMEVHISEDEYVHFEVIGRASEGDVIRTKTNLKRFGQEVKDAVDGEDEVPEEDPKLVQAREMKAYLEDHTQDETATFFNCSRQTVVNRLKLLIERSEG